MNKSEIRKRIQNLNVWKQGSQRAPHKPLLLLYAMGRGLRNKERMIPYAEIDKDLKKLLIEFGLPGKATIRNTLSGACRETVYGNLKT